LNENGTVITRPSNSGMATCMATSIGANPAALADHTPLGDVAAMACTTGTSSSASGLAQPSSPSSEPAASTVVMTASHGRRNSSVSGRPRSE